MFALYDKVMIKSKKIPGTIVDIMTVKNRRVITVESDEEGPIDGGYGKRFPLFDCEENDLEMI